MSKTLSQKEKIQFFQMQLLKWFEVDGRDIPWRKKSVTNYERIISEVLLQRTKAQTVAKYFSTFLKAYPSWKKLGEASQKDLEVILQPLGLYKQRAARLYKLAQEMKRRNGRFPTKRNQVEEMSMMGQYITNAFELFILKKPAPLLDVNMARVLERFFGPRTKADIRYDPYLQELAQKVVNHEKSKEINWAILDLGGLLCTYRQNVKVVCLESNVYFKTDNVVLNEFNALVF